MPLVTNPISEEKSFAFEIYDLSSSEIFLTRINDLWRISLRGIKSEAKWLLRESYSRDDLLPHYGTLKIHGLLSGAF